MRDLEIRCSKTSRRRVRPIEAARERLRAAIDRACLARGEAQWMNGYRTGRYALLQGKDDQDADLYQKELARFELCGKAERQADRARAAYGRAVRQAKGK